MQVKNDLRNNDLESFKNIVNSTNDTHNKLISSIQKNVDQMIRLVKRSLRTRRWSELHRDKSGQEGVTTALEEKISKISALRWELGLWEHTIFKHEMRENVIICDHDRVIVKMEIAEKLASRKWRGWYRKNERWIVFSDYLQQNHHAVLTRWVSTWKRRCSLCRSVSENFKPGLKVLALFKQVAGDNNADGGEWNRRDRQQDCPKVLV